MAKSAYTELERLKKEQDSLQKKGTKTLKKSEGDVTSGGDVSAPTTKPMPPEDPDDIR